jgi:polar amino acid transport system substrate-binding protein
MRISKLAFVIALLASLVAVGASTQASSAAGPRLGPVSPALAKCLKNVKKELLVKGKITVATNNPALAPWFNDNNPGNGEGYESAVAYGVASTLGLKSAAVAWYDEPYELALAAGTKPFDFDINEITSTSALSHVVSLSRSYFEVNQSIVALKHNAITTHHSPTALKKYLYGEPKGSEGLAFVRSHIHPARAPIVYGTLAEAIAALSAKRIDAIVIDTPTGQYLASQLVSGATQVAQFHTSDQYYAILLHKGNPLLSCVNTALSNMRQKNELEALSTKYLSVYNVVPFVKP